MRRELDWIIPVSAILAVQAVACLALSLQFRPQGAPPFLRYGMIAATVCALLIALFSLYAAIKSWRHPSPLSKMGEYFRRRRQRIAIFALGCALASVQLGTLTWTKSLIPLTTPLWADPLLAKADLALIGTDAWRIVHPLLAPVETIIDTLYALWPVFLELTLAAVLLRRPSSRKSVTLVAFFLTIGLTGVAGQFLVPSGGPIFWQRLGYGPHFDAMPVAPHTRWAADYLWANFSGSSVEFATGISAFPSMHVAMAVWIVFACREMFPKASPIAWSYLAVIVLGSVYLGWHYLVDGLGGSAGAILCWLLSRSLMKINLPRRRAAPASPATL